MTPRKVLVRFPNWIGDIVMALPVLDRLERQLPEGALGLQIHPRGRALLEGRTGGVRRYHTVPTRGGARWSAVLAELRAERYDVGLLLTPSFSSALLFFLGGVGERIGWSSELRDALLTRGVPRPGRQARLTHQYQRLLEPLGLAGPFERPRYLPTATAAEEAEGWLTARGLAGVAPVALAPGAAFGSAKRWPADRYRELARRIVSEAGAPVIVFGAASEAPLLDTIGQGLAGVYLQPGALSLPACAALFTHCRALVSNDSGLLHLAAAAGAAVVGLYGSTSPTWTAPDADRLTILSRELSCSPCYRRDCPLPGEARLACLTGIGVDEVLAALPPTPVRSG